MNDDIINKLNEVSNDTNIGEFIQNYRQAYDDQYEADKANLENERKLGHTTIMSANNMRGLLHSSFPSIQKLQYDTTTYEPAYTKLGQSYVTGLDTLYNKAAKYYNQIKEYQRKIADLS